MLSYHAAKGATLADVFNMTPLATDSLVLFPLDIRAQESLCRKFSAGSLVSFDYVDGAMRVAGEYDRGVMPPYIYFVKDLYFKTFQTITDVEARLLSGLNDGFYERWCKNDICIKPDQICSLVRFNLSNVLACSVKSPLEKSLVLH